MEAKVSRPELTRANRLLIAGRRLLGPRSDRPRRALVGKLTGKPQSPVRA
jgi:hypothetical protein